uniref:Glucokinase n=1 Tax=Erythrolobus australicus TaxID=1077150 RepID=A0A7S1XIB1_9RHOD
MADGEPSERLILTGDVGGTNCRLMLFDSVDLKFKTDKVRHIDSFENDDFHSFTDVLCRFLNDAAGKIPNMKIRVACIAVAGPVSGQKINFTNREGWIIDAEDMKSSFNIDRVVLVNDFVANGHGVTTLTDDELIVMQRGRSNPFAPKALVGAGTGLGECFITPAKIPAVPDTEPDKAPGAKALLTEIPACDAELGLSQVFQTEGGHVDFAPRNAVEDRLLEYIRGVLKYKHPDDQGASNYESRHDHDVPRVSVERVVSGKGLVTVYEFLRSEYPKDVVEEHDKFIMSHAPSRAKHLAQMYYDYPLAKQAMDIFFESYGSEAGNVALKYMPFGGLYIAGGIAPKNSEHIISENSGFMQAFHHKGRLSDLIKQIPVYLVVKEDLGLRGAHLVALHELLDLEREAKEGHALVQMKEEPVIFRLKHVMSEMNRVVSESLHENAGLWSLGASIVTTGALALYVTYTLERLVHIMRER